MDSGSSRSQIIDYFTDTCQATPEKAELAAEVAAYEWPVKKAMYKDGISLYIGIPFCPTRCLYCSFVTCGTRQAAKLIPDYVCALKKEIEYTGRLVAENNRTTETVYIGGGTPTTLSAKQLDDMLGQIHKSFDLSHCREFTVEAGRPDTITPEKLEVLKKHGVNRISINPQTMNAQTLKIIGRAHTPQQIKDAFMLAKNYNFDCINMDIIAGLPGESAEMFKYTLNEAAGLDPGNITVHTMSIKRSSRLHEYLSDYELTSGAEVERMIDYARRFMSDNGYHPYYLYRQKNQLGNLENVGYSKDGLDSLYNIYIMEELQTILALGCGGVTKTVDPVTDRIERVFNVKEPQDYLARLDEMLKRKDNIFE